MLRSGKEHLESLRDGRVVYIGNEKVDDDTTRPAFRNAAQTVVALYDMKAGPAGQTARTGARPVLALSKVCGASEVLLADLHVIGRPARYWQTCTRGRTQA
jgi:aromatic ring hydroxylase